MKKTLFGVMAVLLVAGMTFSGCGKDDEDDGSQIDRSSSNVSFSAKLVNTMGGDDKTFSTSDATFCTSRDAELFESTFADISALFNGKSLTTIVGKKGKNILSITYMGRGSETSGKTFSGSFLTVKNTSTNAWSAIVNILKGNETTEEEKYALEKLDNQYYYSALVIYKGKEDVPGSETFYYSSSATVNVSVYTEQFITGSFSTKLVNATGDTFTISDGVFNVLCKDN